MVRQGRAFRILVASLAFAFAALSQDGRAHGGVALEDDLCVISIGYFRAHFKIYQPRESGHEQFCEDIPSRGESVFVMEYSHESLGETPIDFRIVRNVTGKGRFTTPEDLGDPADLDDITVFHRPAEVIPDVYTALYRFEEPGEFIGIVTVELSDGQSSQVAVFPFEVGHTGFGIWPWFIALAVLIQLHYWHTTGRLGRWARRLRGRGAAQTALTAALLILPLAAPASNAVTTADGYYTVRYTAEIDPLVINRMHHWVIHLETADGQPLTGASIEVNGGMPEHDHGLPTQPVMTAELGDGDYRIDGMRFHMNGAWLLELTITSGANRDIAVLELRL